MSRNWIRGIWLAARGPGGDKDLSELRVVFNIQQDNLQTPNIADIFVYNVNKDTKNSFLNKEYTRVALVAGYGNNASIIFRGNIKAAYYGQETPTDTKLELYCGDGDQAYNYAHVNKTFPAGSRPMDHVEEAVRAMGKHGVDKGYIAGIPDVHFPKPIVLFERARDTLRRICNLGGASWSIQDGQVQVVPKQGTLPGGETVLNSATGLIGRPIQSPGGIQVRSLLDPQARVNGVIRINNESIVRAAPDRNEARGDNTNSKLPDLDTDGRYKILVLNRIGDTHAREWYNEMTCLAASNSGWTPNNLLQYQTNTFAGAQGAKQ